MGRLSERDKWSNYPHLQDAQDIPLLLFSNGLSSLHPYLKDDQVTDFQLTLHRNVPFTLTEMKVKEPQKRDETWPVDMIPIIGYGIGT